MVGKSLACTCQLWNVKDTRSWRFNKITYDLEQPLCLWGSVCASQPDDPGSIPSVFTQFVSSAWHFKPHIGFPPRLTDRYRKLDGNCNVTLFNHMWVVSVVYLDCSHFRIEVTELSWNCVSNSVEWPLTIWGHKTSLNNITLLWSVRVKLYFSESVLPKLLKTNNYQSLFY
jgi:hypothetical protein